MALKVRVYDGLIGKIFYMLARFIFRRISIRLFTCSIILIIMILILVGHYTSILMFLVLFTRIIKLGIESVCFWPFVCEALVANFERLHLNCSLVEESGLRANYVVNLTHLFHNFDLIEIYVCRDKIDIPHCVISMKIDRALHRKLSQIR